MQRTESYYPVELQLPDVYPCEHIADYLFEVGPTTGENPVAWTEIDRWCERTGVALSEFEAVTIVALSKAYLGMLHEARDERCPPPYFVEKSADVKAVVANRLREALRMAAQANEKKGKRRQ